MPYVKVALNLPIAELFDYLIPEELSVENLLGARVIVPFGRRNIIGLIVEVIAHSKIKMVKPILKIIDPLSLLNYKALQLAKRISQYYSSSQGQAIFTMLPLGIRKGMAVSITPGKDIPREKNNFKVNFLQNSNFDARLQLYDTFIKNALAEKENVIVLSPQINSCIKIAAFLKQEYGDKIGVTYRRQNVKEELALWGKAKNAMLDIVIGTRSAVFTPFSNLGLIIMDDEEGYGYKEEQAPYYHARDVALMRGRLEKIPVVLGAAIPSLESFYCIKSKKYALLSVPEKHTTPQPKITIVDIRHYASSRDKFRGCISPVLEDRLHKILGAGKKAILFINRKGFASLAYCQKCGFILSCDTCSSKLTFYFEEKKLICQSCGGKKELLSICPKCNAHYISYRGLGIEKVLSQLHLLFPDTKIARLDKEHQNQYGDFQVLISTEMLFSSTDTPKAHLVAAIDIDTTLQFVDFRSNERLYALLLRLKDIAYEELIIQTWLPEYYQRKECSGLKLHKLFSAELRERKALELPPFTHLITLNVRGKNMERAKTTALRLYEGVKGRDDTLSLFEPVEAMPFKLRGNFRFKIVLKAKNPPYINSMLKEELKKIKTYGIIITVDVDPSG